MFCQAEKFLVGKRCVHQAEHGGASSLPQREACITNPSTPGYAGRFSYFFFFKEEEAEESKNPRQE